jgi:hypothetical protein
MYLRTLYHCYRITPLPKRSALLIDTKYPELAPWITLSTSLSITRRPLTAS